MAVAPPGPVESPGCCSYHKLSLLVHQQVVILTIWQEKIRALSSPSVVSHEFVNQKSTPSSILNMLNS